MAESSDNLPSATTEASKATAQTRTEEPSHPKPKRRPPAKQPGEGKTYEIGEGVSRAVYGRPYERQGDDPLYRPLKIFALDPAASRLEGAVALVNVPYEPLKAGPVGEVFIVSDRDDGNAKKVLPTDPLNLDAAANLIRNGRSPSPSDRLFHNQMAYAVCSLVYAAFRTALGRHIAWGFSVPKRTQLLIRPHAFEGRNAFYQKETGELCFGYFKAEETLAGRNLPGGVVYTCLSHDIVAHEVTHALLDGLRCHFTFPTNSDVVAFHEAFADLVAIFQHFSYDQVLQSAIRKSRGNLRLATLLTDIAQQFGQTTKEKGKALDREKALRSAIGQADEDGNPQPYDSSLESHTLGSILVAAVFEAFTTIFDRKTRRFILLATGGTGELPPGEIPHELQAILAAEASKLASQFLAICIRAIDYCPPVDMTFGDFLRAVITADRDLVPDDPWGYREAWIDAFRRRHIYPLGVDNLSEDALVWKGPGAPGSGGEMPKMKGLTFAELKFEGDPARPANEKELRRQAGDLGRMMTKPKFLKEFGFIASNDEDTDLPKVQSIRSSRRVGPDGQVVFDLVAEVTQRITTRTAEGDTFHFYGGSTVIIDPNGAIRYLISKRITNEGRMKNQSDFLLTNGQPFWEESNGMHVPRKHLFRFLHDEDQANKKIANEKLPQKPEMVNNKAGSLFSKRSPT